MVVTNRKKDRCEEYWQAYFARLNNLSPHEPTSVAAQLANARAVTAIHCKDGILFTFEEANDVVFDHKSTMHSVEATLFRLTEVLGGIGFNPFPDSQDFTLSGADVGLGETKEIETIFPRMAWFRDPDLHLMTLEAAQEKARSDHEGELKTDLWTAPAPSKDRKPN
jgi:hypothetical protein